VETLALVRTASSARFPPTTAQQDMRGVQLELTDTVCVAGGGWRWLVQTSTSL
jgi:hypothetical protein